MKNIDFFTAQMLRASLLLAQEEAKKPMQTESIVKSVRHMCNSEEHFKATVKAFFKTMLETKTVLSSGDLPHEVTDGIDTVSIINHIETWENWIDNYKDSEHEHIL